jgi:hypothetical protein
VEPSIADGPRPVTPGAHGYEFSALVVMLPSAGRLALHARRLLP